VDHAHEAQLDGDDPARQHVHGVRPGVHQVQLGDHGQGALTVGVHFPGQLERLGGGHVGVGGRDGQDDAVGVADVFQDELPDLDLDVFGLVSHRNLGKGGGGGTRQTTGEHSHTTDKVIGFLKINSRPWTNQNRVVSQVIV
ncbi:hypothetical protein ANANG_G00310500, partial [Anguilla anguilla]